MPWLFRFCRGFFVLPQQFLFWRGFFDLAWLIKFAMAFLFCRGFFVLPWLFWFVVAFLFDCSNFCFAVALLICRGFLSFAVAFSVCRDFFILPWHFFCRGFFVLLWLFGFAVTLMDHRKKGLSKNDTFKFYAFRFLEKWAWVIIIFIHFLFRDICVNMAYISNRALKFDTFYTLILSFGNGISNEWTSLPQKEKKVVTCLTNTLSNDCDMI